MIEISKREDGKGSQDDLFLMRMRRIFEHVLEYFLFTFRKMISENEEFFLKFFSSKEESRDLEIEREEF